MDYSNIIDDILLEVSVDIPIVDLKNPVHILALIEVAKTLGYHEVVPLIEEEFLITEKKEPSQAEKLGLVHVGRGYYAKEKGKPATHKSDGDMIKPLSPGEDDSKTEKPSVDTKDDTQSKPKADDKSPESAPAPSVTPPPPTADAKKSITKPNMIKKAISKKIKNWTADEKKFFEDNQHSPNSDTRRSFGQALRDKVKGMGKAIKHGFKHEVHTFKAAGKAAQKIFSTGPGNKLTKEDKKALVSVAVKVASTAVFGAAFGGLAHGAAAFAKHVAIELIPHVVGETILVGAARGSVFASADGHEEQALADFMNLVAEKMEQMPIDLATMESIIDKWEMERDSKMTPSQDQLSESTETNGESKKFPGKFHLGGGYYSPSAGGEAQFKSDGNKLTPLRPDEKAEFERKSNGGDEKEDEMISTAMDRIETGEKSADQKAKQKERENMERAAFDDPDSVLDNPSAPARIKAIARHSSNIKALADRSSALENMKDIKKWEEDKSGKEILDDERSKYLNVKELSDKDYADISTSYNKDENFKNLIPYAFKDENEFIEKVKQTDQTYLTSFDLSSVINLDLSDIISAGEDGKSNMIASGKSKASQYGKDFDGKLSKLRKSTKITPVIAIKDKEGKIAIITGKLKTLVATADGKTLPTKLLSYNGKFSDTKPFITTDSPEDVTRELPNANKQTFTSTSDLGVVSQSKKNEISMMIDKLAEAVKKAKESGENAPDINLCKITVPGTNLYCDGNKGIPRDQMPQFKGTAMPGTPAEKLPKDAKGEVDTEPLFKKMLSDKNIKVVSTDIPSDRLKATQSELVGAKVAGMTKALEENPDNPGITAPIYVSRDGYVIDGHHRWAAVTSYAIKSGTPVNMKVLVIDMDVKDAIPMANKFAEDMGISAKKAQLEPNSTKLEIIERLNKAMREEIKFF